MMCMNCVIIKAKLFNEKIILKCLCGQLFGRFKYEKYNSLRNVTLNHKGLFYIFDLTLNVIK